MWHPEMGPIAYAIASSESPKAKAMPSTPIACPAITAEPTPPNTRTNVPTASATGRRWFMACLPALGGMRDRPDPPAPGPCCHAPDSTGVLALGAMAFRALLAEQD